MIGSKLFVYKGRRDRSGLIEVSSLSECEEWMCQYVSEYETKLKIKTDSSFDYQQLIKEFFEKYISFYPNLVHVEAQGFGYAFGPQTVEISFEYRLGKVKLKQMEQEINAEIENLSKALFLPNMSPAVKIYLAHNYLATNVEYVRNWENDLAMSYSQSAYGALILKKSVCQGYAEAFKRLMDHEGIECYVTHGNTKGSSEGHAWNIVALGNGSSYYHVDVTWDAGKKPQYTYFCKNDDFFKGQRTWNKEYHPVCTGSFPVLSLAQKWIKDNYDKLIAKGIADNILDCKK